MPPTTPYTTQLLQHLPGGDAWPREEGTELWQLLDGLGVEFSRIEARGVALLDEADPRTTSELLDDWERVCGLPGNNPNPPTTDDDRRAALHAHLVGLGTPTPANFEALFTAVNAFYAYFDWENFSPFVAGSPVGDALSQDEWQSTRRLHLLTYDRGGVYDQAIEWIVDRLVPDHAVLLMQWIWRTSWTAGVKPQRNAIAHNGNGVWVAVGALVSGYNAVRAEPQWNTHTDVNITVSEDLNACVYDPTYGLWWVFGDGPVASPPTIRVSSDDGRSFPGSLTAPGYLQDLLGCAIDDTGIKIAVGQGGGIIRIPDAGSVISKETPAGGFSNVFYEVHWADSLFIAVGNLGEIQSSPDGVTWTSRTPGGYASALRDVYWHDGLWVAVGHSGEVQTSPDGITWTRRTSTVFSGTVRCVRWVADRWFVGMESGTYRLYWSTDPTDPDSWTVLSSSAFAPLKMAWDGRWVGSVNSAGASFS